MQNAEASVWRHLHDDFDQIFSLLLGDYKGNGMESVLNWMWKCTWLTSVQKLLMNHVMYK